MAQRSEQESVHRGSDGDDAYSGPDHTMIDYALRWVNHGGGPEEDIHTRFDTTAREFYRTVLDILERDPGRTFGEFGLSPVMVTRSKAVARRRIWITS
ncbi:hypothetical protein [Rhodococcus sp. 14-2470-1a]|uniref:hypothetical protein n=1 Tax=Rhodococcus sp. 14-2470-1a TaxID=2023150 RepID=UPI00117BABBD|nr:hypothetical protein [Rhodococcus sp. 14-2470-1a]